ncbi:MAG: hypothetical protein Q9167_007620 [Letrouitia subvulpina]
MVKATPAPTSVPLSLILRNSSFAALGLPDNERRVFFQDESGVIRQALYSANSRQWLASNSTEPVSSNALNHTPLAAINVVGNANAGVCRNSISSMSVTNLQAASATLMEIPSSLPSQIISDEPIPSDITDVYDVTTSWGWQEVSNSHWKASLISRIGAPFSSSYDGKGVSAVFMDTSIREAKTGTLLYTELSDTTPKICSLANYFTQGFNTHNQSSAEDPVPIELSSLLSLNIRQLIPANLSNVTQTEQYNYWVDGASLRPASRVVSPFPFPQLGGFAPFNGTILYFYHQVNDTAFAEDQWDETTGIWTSTNITIDF